MMVHFQVLLDLCIETCGDILENGDRLLLAFGENTALGYLKAAVGIGTTVRQGIQEILLLVLRYICFLLFPLEVYILLSNAKI